MELIDTYIIDSFLKFGIGEGYRFVYSMLLLYFGFQGVLSQ